MNWRLFPNARVAISGAELDWALGDSIENCLVPDLDIEELERSPQLRRIAPGDEVIDGFRALEMPGHTPHHLIFVGDHGSARLILAADAVKNRAELLSSRSDLTMDAGASSRSIAAIRALWAERAGAVLVAGHDLPMENRDGVPVFLGSRRAGIAAWFDEELDAVTRIPLDGSVRH